MNSKKRFLLIAPWDYQLYAVIEKNLIHLGYEVVVLHNNTYPFVYKDKRQRTTNFLRKTFLNDKGYKNALIRTYSDYKRMSVVQSYDHFDITLVIRADFFDTELLLEARKRSDKFISFHYDGISRNLMILPRIHLFDHFYVFDRQDVITYQKYGVEYAPNFYFDYPEEDTELTEGEVQNKIYYISSYHPSRLDIIQSFYQFISSKISPVQFDFVYNHYDEHNIPAFVKENFTCHHRVLPYEYQLRMIRNSEIILDFCIDEHSGFSFRIFDGIKLEKKVITTNPYVVNEDFYHPNNFFVLTEENKEELDAFLELPFVKLDENIRRKYYLGNWLEAVTNYPVKPSKALAEPLISVIIPCYNNERVIIEAIESVEKQTYSNVEMIVVDDGSTDQTAEVVRNYSRGKSNIKFFSKPNGGPASTRNYGFDRSSGQFIVFLDGDDRLHPDFIKEHFEIFRKHIHLSLVYSNAEFFEGKTGPWHIIDYNSDEFLISNAIPIFAMVSAAAFERAGKFDEQLKGLEDWELWIRILTKNSHVYKIKKPLYYYRKRIEQNSLTDHADFHVDSVQYYHYIYNKHLDAYRARHLDLLHLLDSHRHNKSIYQDFVKYRRKYYSVWYRKWFYYFFRREKYNEIFSR